MPFGAVRALLDAVKVIRISLACRLTPPSSTDVTVTVPVLTVDPGAKVRTLFSLTTIVNSLAGATESVTVTVAVAALFIVAVTVTTPVSVSESLMGLTRARTREDQRHPG